MSNIMFAILVLGSIMLGIAFGTLITQEAYQQEAAEHSCAAYDVTTGEWGWKSE